MKLEKWMHKRKVLILVCILSFVLFLYLSFNSYEMYSISRDDYLANNIDAIRQRMDSLFLEINEFPEDEGNDILYLGRMNNLNKLINSDKDGLDLLRIDVQNDFSVFMGAHPIYYQARYIDENGMEIITVNRDGENVSVAPESQLQNKKTRSYFINTMLLKRDEVYVSPLDLNIEEGVIENKGTKENPKYVPVMRYSMPLFDNEEGSKGLVILNVNADYFLEDIRRLDRENEISFLVDNNGYYLAHPNRSKEFSFMFDGKNSISSDYGRIGNEVVNNLEVRYLEDETHIFAFRHLYPTIGTFEIYQGAKRLFGENPEEDYYWTLVSIVDKKDVHSNIKNMRVKIITFILISALMVSVIIILLLIILALNGDWTEVKNGR